MRNKMWHVAGPSEYLAITGQKCVNFDVSLVNYTFEVQAMSAEELPFILDAVFTIGPRVTDDECLPLYAKLIAPHDKLSSHVQGIIESETRVIAASMTMEQIFKGTADFKKELFEKLQLELNQFGLVIYNANVKQLVDVVGHEYFSNLGQNTQVEATNQVKVDVAEAKMKGEVGAMLCAGQTKQNAAKIDAETKIIATRWQGEGQKEEIMVRTAVKMLENQKEAELAKANAELAAKKAAWSQSANLAKVEAAKQVALREAELQLQVEKKKTLTQTEKLRAQLLSKAIVEYEIKVQAANWELYKKQRAADAVLYENLKNADAQKATAQAEGEHLAMLVKQFGCDYGAMKDYLMLRRSGLQELPKFNAGAEKRLAPKPASGPAGGKREGGSGGVDGRMKEVARVNAMLQPLFKSLRDVIGTLD